MLKLLQHHLIRSKAAVAWSTSAIVHAVAGGVMASGGAAIYSFWDNGMPQGNAVTLQARFASQSSASDELQDFTVSRRDETWPRSAEHREVSPQRTEPERASTSVEYRRPVVDQGEIAELSEATEIRDLAAERKIPQTNEPRVVEAEAEASPRRAARRIAELSLSDRDLLADNFDVQPSVAGADVPPHPLPTNASPGYPIDARRARRGGQGIVRFQVSPEGKVVWAAIVKSSGWSDLDASALSAIKTWKFAPARREGLPIAHEFTQPFEFRVED